MLLSSATCFQGLMGSGSVAVPVEVGASMRPAITGAGSKNQAVSLLEEIQYAAFCWRFLFALEPSPLLHGFKNIVLFILG